jgi:hypothetical protein
MGVGQVRDVDVVPDRRAVRGVVVRAEDLDVPAKPERGLDDQGNQMRLGIVVLADLAVRVGPAALK